MRIPLFALISSIIPLIASAQKIETDTVYSTNAKDRYVIYIKKPAGYSPTRNYHHIYMTDGNIGIGDYVLGKSESWKATQPPNCIVIAIGHLGDWHQKRSRDLIPSDISNNSTADFGKAASFLAFLKQELIPKIDEKLGARKERVFIGHSFGGLFCLYMLFKDSRLFDRYFAISPSIWANYYELDKIEKAYFKTHKQLPAKVTLYVGTLEFLNKVLYSSRSFVKTLSERHYADLEIEKVEINYANHFSIRKPAIDRIFEIMNDPGK